MKIKSLTALLCVAALLFNVVSIPVYAQETEIELLASDSAAYVSSVTRAGAQNMVKPTTQTNMLWDNFEDGNTSDWYFRNTNVENGRKAEILEENGNKFLRFSLTNGSYPSTFNEVNEKLPVLSRSFVNDGAIKVDMNNISVFEMNVRTSSINDDVSKLMLINYPYPGEKLPDGTDYTRANTGLSERGWSTRIHFQILKPNGLSTFFPRSNWVAGGHQGSYTELTTAEANEWYKLRYVYNNAAEPRTVSVYMYDSSESLVSCKENVELTAWWYTHYDLGTQTTPPKFPITNHEIYDITLRFDVPSNVPSSATFDIDDLRIFPQKTNVNTSVSTNTDIGILYKPTEVSLYFDAPVNYTDGGILIKDSSGNMVAHNGEYDETSHTYKATFDSVLPSGDYTFELTDSVTPLNATEGKISNMGFASNSVSFKSYDTMPPYANNVEIDGRIIPNTQLNATYDFITESGTEQGSVFKWFESSTGEEGTFTEITGFNEKTLDVSNSGVYGKYVQFSVTPKASNGLEGVEVFSNIIIPEEKPVVQNLKLSSQTLFPDLYVSPVYDFFDANEDDIESDSIVEWYKSSDGVSNWTLIGTAEKYQITDADMGYYIKCVVTPKSNSECESTGEPGESDAVGPVADLLETTNLFIDPSFETSAIGEYWESTPAKDSIWEGMSITSEAARTGNYSIHMPPRVLVNDSWGQRVNVTKDNVYLLGGYAKKANEKLSDASGLWPYTMTEGVTRGETNEADYTYTLTKRWQLCVATYIADVTRRSGFNFVAFNNMGNIDALFDDLYVGELLVADIESYDVEDVVIPAEGSVSYVLSSGRVLNQLGTDHGLKNQVVCYELPESDGVSVEDGKLVVTNKAKAGRINVKLYCIPTFSGADQNIFEKYVSVNLVPNNDKAPKAYDVTASGDVAVGNTLTGSYKFYQIESKNDASTYTWTYCDSEDGKYQPIPGATSLTYTVESAYADKYIKFCVTPKTDEGVVGTATYSNLLTIPRVPSAVDVTFDGDFNVGGTVEATYTFHDPNGDDEGATLYRWMADGVIIPGETGKTLTFTENLIGKNIQVGVTPVSQLPPQTGVEILSEVKLGPSVPMAIEVMVENNNGRLAGKYTYTHPHGFIENGTTFKWTVDGVTVSDKAYYVPNFSGNKNVTFTVTPKSEGNPSVGRSVSVSVTITGSVTNGSIGTGGVVGGGFVGGGFAGGGFAGGGGGASSGGGGGAGSGSGTGITNINDMNLVDPTKEAQQPKSDIDDHWGKTYIEEMADRGVMSADEEGNFNPDVNVTREEMLTFLFDALGLEETAYSGQFSDVAEGDFANKLQTMLDNGTIAKDTNFRPEDTISREEMCKILYISLENAGKLNEVEDDLIIGFADYDSISDWARVYVNAIFGNEIMVGVSETEFDAKGTVTKAQAATMLVRILALTEVE